MKNEGQNKIGKFISIEGCDGAGKTTAAKYLAAKLSETPGSKIMLTREPGGTHAAEIIRKALFDVKAVTEEVIQPETEALLVHAARFQHITNKVIPAVEEGTYVISDRFNDSTWAYQYYAGGCSKYFLQEIEDAVLEAFKPDLVIIMDGNPENLIERMKGTDREKPNAFDTAEMSFKQDVRKGLICRAERKSKTLYFILNAERSLEDVQKMLDMVVTLIPSMPPVINNLVRYSAHRIDVIDGVAKFINDARPTYLVHNDESLERVKGES